MVRVLTVTSEGETGGLTLREAIARAGRKETLIQFDDDVSSVSLSEEIKVGGRARITIDGDKDGDGISDVYIDTEAHHFTVGAKANLTLRDLLLYGGSSIGATGAPGKNQPSVSGYADDGRDGEQLSVDLDDYPATSDGNAAMHADVEKLTKERLPDAQLDATDGVSGRNGADGGDGENGASVAGSILNSGDLTLVRVGFMYNSAYGGDGGKGGAGGRGWNGGNGGDGAVGAIQTGSTRYEVGPDIRDSGDGGDGGDGGHGGKGGLGGRGGDAAAAILNRDSGTVTLVDVSLGGRMANGSLTDQYGMQSKAGDGGVGGAGGDGGQAGIAGEGADDMVTLSINDAIPTEDVYELYDGEGTRYYWEAKILVGHPWERGFVVEDSYIHKEDAFGRGYLRPTTEAGDGGDGGEGGRGGDAGANGGGGNAAPIVNYGTIRGTLASGTEDETEAGKGAPGGLYSMLGSGGSGGPATTGHAGGHETIELELRTEPASYELDKDSEIFDGFGFAMHPFMSYGDRVIPKPALDDRYFAQDPAPRGLDGTDGADGVTGSVGRIGQARRDVYSEGIAAGTNASDGLVYLTGVRQSDDFGTLMFSLVRVGDTSDTISVTYEIGGAGRDGVGRGDFLRPGALKKTVTFEAIDQSALTYDDDGKGVANIEIDLKADGIREGAEGFRITLSSDDVALGTHRFRGAVWDSDFRSVVGTIGNDRRLAGSRKDDVIDADAGNDRLFGKGGGDVLLGDEGRDILKGGGGADTLIGGDKDDKGNDKLFGQNGNDVLQGGGGRDLLDGGHGSDTLTGGADGDRFVFYGRKSGADVITDFGKGDVIDLTAYDDLHFRDLDISREDGGTLVAWDGGSVLLVDVAIKHIEASDFDFA